MITLTLDGVPPSLNRTAGRANVWEYRRTKDEWTAAVVWAIKVAKCKPPRPFELAHITLHYFFPDRRRRDADNYAGKFLLDGLTRGGIIVDDDMQHISTTIKGDVDKTKPRTVITVEEIKN